MAKMIQVRNVPDKVHRTLKSRAALKGVSLSDYLLAEIDRMVALPTEEELRLRLQKNDPVDMDVSSAEIIRKDRDAA